MPRHRGEGELARLVRALQLRRERDVYVCRAEATRAQQLSNADSLYTSLHSERHVAPAREPGSRAVPDAFSVTPGKEKGEYSDMRRANGFRNAKSRTDGGVQMQVIKDSRHFTCPKAQFRVPADPSTHSNMSVLWHRLDPGDIYSMPPRVIRPCSDGRENHPRPVAEAADAMRGGRKLLRPRKRSSLLPMYELMYLSDLAAGSQLAACKKDTEKAKTKYGRGKRYRSHAR